MALDSALPVAFGFSLVAFVSSAWALLLAWRRGAVANAEQRRIAKMRRETARAEKRRLKTVKRVAKEIRPQVIQALARYGFSYIYERQGAMTRMSTPKINVVLFTQDAIYYRIAQLPFRTRFTDLLTPEVEKNLSLTIGRECRFVDDIEIGVWLQVGLRSGVSAIPRWFDWESESNPQNAMELIPAGKPWAIPIGMTENRRFIYEDFRDLPHLIVAGATDGGKSVFLNQMLCTLISRNPPSRLQITLIDLKGGLEFWPYRTIPHLRREVVINPDNVPGVLDDIRKEKERRFTMLRNANVQNIRGWNQTKPNKLPYIAVFFDEIMGLMLNRKIKHDFDRLIDDLASQGRALGIHLVLCTQVPTREVLSTIIRGNIHTRVVFAMDDTASMICLNNGRAANLPAKSGRMIFKRSMYQTEIQGPWISKEQIDTAVTASNLTDTAANEEVTASDVLKMSLYNLGGKFTVRALLDCFGSAVSHPFINQVADSYEYSNEEQGPVIEIDGGRYILGRVPMRGGWGRHLLPLAAEEAPPSNDEALLALWESVKESDQGAISEAAAVVAAAGSLEEE